MPKRKLSTEQPDNTSNSDEPLRSKDEPVLDCKKVRSTSEQQKNWDDKDDIIASKSNEVKGRESACVVTNVKDFTDGDEPYTVRPDTHDALDTSNNTDGASEESVQSTSSPEGESQNEDGHETGCTKDIEKNQSVNSKYIICLIYYCKYNFYNLIEAL